MCEYDVRLWHLRNVWKDLNNKVKRVPALSSNINLTSMRNAKNKQYLHIMQTQCEVRELRAKNGALWQMLKGLRHRLSVSMDRYEDIRQQQERHQFAHLQPRQEVYEGDAGGDWEECHWPLQELDQNPAPRQEIQLRHPCV